MGRKIFKGMNILYIALLILSGGCAAEVQKSTKRYVWPTSPAEPKIEWLKSYYDQHDFPKSGFEAFTEALLGKPEPISFTKPIDIKANGKGLVYITDISREAVIVYDLVNHRISVWPKVPDPDNSLAITPFYIALDRDSNLYAVGQGDTKIYVLDGDGRLKRKIDYEGKIKYVGGIAVDDARGRIYLVDHSGGKVEVFELSGKHLFSFGKPGAGDGEFNRPNPITINRKGEILVGDTMNARVQIFDGEGKFLRKFGERGDRGSDFQVLKGVATDSEDNIYVTDGKANQLKIFNTNGEYLLSLGISHSVPNTLKELPGGFLLPQGIHIDSTDTIYIVDQANMRFQLFKYLKAPESGTGDAGVRPESGAAGKGGGSSDQGKGIKAQ